MKILDIQEDAGIGATSSASIAAAPAQDPSMRRRPIRNGDHDWHQSIAQERSPEALRQRELQSRGADSMRAAKEKLRKQNSFRQRLKQFFIAKQRGMFRVSESFDMNDVLSRLSDLQGKGEGGDSTVSYGIEDDNGNLMKVTVRAEQAEEFEERLANELADAARRTEVTGSQTSVSMAELLYNLRDEFDIVDVQFPQIPTDGVYNADKVQYNTADTAQEDIVSPGEDELGIDGFPEDATGGPPGGPGGPGGAEGGDPLAGATPMDGGAEGGMEGGEGGEGLEGEGGEDEEFFDDGSVEDFPAEPAAGANPEETMLSSILKMLTADADSRRAEADARAEEARAKQAEFSALAAKNAIGQQEEVMRMEAEIEEKKKQEKDAKRISDLARYRVSKASGGGFAESAKPTFGQFVELVLEFDEFDTAATLSKQKSGLRQKFAIMPEDDQETIRYKREAMSSAMREIDSKMRRVAAAKRYKDALDRKARLQGQKPQPSMNPQQQAMQAQQQQQANAQNPQGAV